jgi:uncharacterized protein
LITRALVFLGRALRAYTSEFQSLPSSIQRVVRLVVDGVQPEAVLLFGSRARGDQRVNSDFDFAVKSARLDPGKWAEVQVAIAEEPLTLYSVDLVHFEAMSLEYQVNISREGKLLYG